MTDRPFTSPSTRMKLSLQSWTLVGLAMTVLIVGGTTTLSIDTASKPKLKPPTKSSTCTAIAADLSARFNSTYQDPTQNEADDHLESFLAENGLLVTMCMRYRGMLPWAECSVPKPKTNNHQGMSSTQISASWVHTKKTQGFRVIGHPIDVGPPVGLVLNPTALSIRCLYPADAGTVGRDDSGCGVPSNDPQYGTNGYDHVNWMKRILMKQEVINYRNSVFGKGRPWNTIPCSSIMNATDPDNPNLQVLGHLIDDDLQKQRWEVFTIQQLIVDQWSYFMGFPICNDSSPVMPPNLNDGLEHQLIYLGLNLWQPSNWTNSVNLMMKLLYDEPTLSVWNELVLDVPFNAPQAMPNHSIPVHSMRHGRGPQIQSTVRNIKDNDPRGITSNFPSHAVEAVFYKAGNGVIMDTVSRSIARRVGRRLGKPVLVVQNLPNETQRDPTTNLFQCDE